MRGQCVHSLIIGCPRYILSLKIHIVNKLRNYICAKFIIHLNKMHSITLFFLCNNKATITGAFYFPKPN